MAVRGIAVEVLVLPLLLPLLHRRAHCCAVVGRWLLVSVAAVRCGLGLLLPAKTWLMLCVL
jgi:hypothetical protein